MQELKALRTYVKSLLKMKRMTYKELAKKLNVSEVSVKRWLSSSDISLKKMIQIGEILDFRPFDMIQSDFSNKKNFRYYTPEQESYLCQFPVAFYIFIKLAFNYDLKHIQTKARLNEKELRKLLKGMEKIKLIELWPGDRIKIKHVGMYRGYPDRGIVKKYHPLMAEALSSHFLKKFPQRIEDPSFPTCSLYRPTELYLTEASAARMSQEMIAVFSKYMRIGHIEKTNKQAIKPVSVLLGIDHFDVWEKILLA